VYLPDHSGQGCRVTKDLILRDWFAIVNTHTNGFPDDACLDIKMDMVRDIVLMKDSSTFWWAQFRLYDPTSKP
jgi:hypothetical protein